MTDREALIVRLINHGYRRSKIADLAGIPETEAREIIRRLCAEHDCRMDQLPAKVNLPLAVEPNH